MKQTQVEKALADHVNEASKKDDAAHIDETEKCWRLDCLRLAESDGQSKDTVLDRAKAYHAWISGQSDG